MSVRMFQARLECDRETLGRLWLTHRVFNERLPAIISVLFKMRRGECGRNKRERNLYQRMARFFLAMDSKSADYLFNSISIRNWTPHSALKMKAKVRDAAGTETNVSADTWALDAAALSAKGRLLYEKNALLGDLPPTLRQMVCREAVSIISGHDELLAQWEKAHEEWLKDKARWESDEEHKKYLALRPRFEAFEAEAGGKAAKRRGRWHKYFTWLKQNPDLAAWRGKAPAGIEGLSPDARRRAQRAGLKRRVSVEAEEFWKANPELSALDRLHGYYERTFVRRRKTKKNPDGFDHRPTFTLPHYTRHPRWFVFNAPQTKPIGYGNLALPPKSGEPGSVELLLVTGEKQGEQFPSDRLKVSFLADPRLSAFHAVNRQRLISRGKHQGEAADTKSAYEFFDRHLAKPRQAKFKGVKLIFRLHPDATPKAAYLYFACEIADEPLSDKAKAIQWTDTGEVTRKGKRRKTMRLPNGIVLAAVDLGIRNLGFATLAQKKDSAVEVLRSRNLWVGLVEPAGSNAGRWAAGPDLHHISRHKKRIRALRRERGKPVAGETSHVRLQDHIDNMSQDRFKRMARAIVNFALNTKAEAGKKGPYPRADVLILEQMAGLIPDAEKERGINRALMAWNRGQLVERVKDMAQDAGLKVREINPFGTSQVCSKCGTLGRRYSIVRDRLTGDQTIRFGFVEKLFACPDAKCGYRANADHNASVNLHRRFVLGDAAVKAFEDCYRRPESERKSASADIESQLLPRLRVEHGLDEAPPF